MTKREIVLNSFGEFKEYVEHYVDENGWLNREEHSAFIRNHFFLTDNLETKFVDKVEFWRPKSLGGIEDNNGWVKVISNDNLPENLKIYHFIPCGNYEEVFTGFIDNSLNEVFFVDKFYESEKLENNRYSLKLNSWLPEQITHYKQIEKIELPKF